jgi:hypothetical protein
MSTASIALDIEQRLAPPPRSPAIRAMRWAVDRYDGLMAAGSVAFDRNFLVIRPAVAGLVIVVVLLQGDGFPGREAVLLAASLAILYNLLLAVLMALGRHYLQRSLSMVLDNVTVFVTTFYMFMKAGEQGFYTDLWLLYLCLIVIAAIYYGPIGSLFFTALWTGLFVAVSLLFFPRDSIFVEQLPTRLMFFVLIGLTALSLSAELRKRRARLEGQSRQTLLMLATIVEARDTDAGLHLRHIQHYSRILALKLGFDRRMADEIAYAATVHDVGKAQVPDAILKKPGALTPQERREMQKHTIWGDGLLAENDEFAMAREVARSHHERWDGNGYPDGLAGDEIPLAARVVAVADVYDALISERPYKEAWPPERAIAEIRNLRGSHLDPVVVDAFVDLYESGALQMLEARMRADDETPGWVAA